MPKVVETTECKHGMKSYHYADGKVLGCATCYPSPPKVKTHKKITNYGEMYVNGSDHNHVKKTGFVEYTVPGHAEVEFFNNCIDCGVDLEYGENNVNGLKVVVYHSNAKNNVEKQWFSSNVYFAPDENFEVPPGVNVHYKGNRAYVSNNDFAGYVLSEVLKG